jgi:triosephosphate isomerase
MKKQYIIANWKMNGSTASLRALSEGLVKQVAVNAGATIVLCPPYPYLPTIQTIIRDSQFKLGAQDVDAHENGAYTGGISANMLADLGCEYVLIGHSERRGYYGEAREVLTAKYYRALDSNLIPIYCIGEKKDDRLNNLTESVLKEQILSIFEKNTRTFLKAVVAYEPVWAIGSGEVPSNEVINHTLQYVRRLLTSLLKNESIEIVLLYGGSVNANNAKDILALSEVDGLLVGGASLKVDSFLEIISCIN